MKPFLAVVFILMAGSLAFALPTAPDTCQTQILLNEMITLCILAIIVGILIKTVSIIIKFEIETKTILILVGIAIVILFVYAFIVGGMSPCTPLPS